MTRLLQKQENSYKKKKERKRFQLAASEMYVELRKHCMVILPFNPFTVLISAVGGERSILICSH